MIAVEDRGEVGGMRGDTGRWGMGDGGWMGGNRVL